jgi:large subunit ribosomal protein L25
MVTIEVPVHLVGEAAASTLVTTERDVLAVLADATRLPEFLEVSISGLEPGAVLTAADVTLPDGVELAVDPETTIAAVRIAPTAEDMAGAAAPEAAEAV